MRLTSVIPTLPVARIREEFPSLRPDAALFDAPGGTQTPRRVADAVRDATISPVSQRGTHNAYAAQADRIVRDARAAAADLLGADAGSIVFGRSATQLTFEFATAFAARLAPGDEVVVSRLDHDANVRPWVLAAQTSGARIRWIDFDRQTGDLTPDDVAAALSERTRVVALTAASNLYGTRVDVPAISALVHDVGALLYVDAVAAAPHSPVDLQAWGADLVVCSPYKFCGPHLGVLAGTPEVLHGLHPRKLAPSTDVVPERFELGTLPYELLAGVTATLDFLADLAPSAGTRRERLAHSFDALEAHEAFVNAAVHDGLLGIPGVRRIGAPADAVPITLFTIDGVAAAKACRLLGERDVIVGGGTFYAHEAAAWAGLGEGGIRVGVAPYNTLDDAERLVTAVADVARSARHA